MVFEDAGASDVFIEGDGIFEVKVHVLEFDFGGCG